MSATSSRRPGGSLGPLPMETRPIRSAAGAAMGPTGGGQWSVGREPGTRLLSHVAVEMDGAGCHRGGRPYHQFG